MTPIDVCRTASLLQVRAVESPFLNAAHASASITVKDHIITNAQCPIVLGSYRFNGNTNREIDIIVNGKPIESYLKSSFRPENLTIKRYLDHGISAWNMELFTEGIHVAPFPSNDEPAEDNTWYFLAKTADIADNAELVSFLRSGERKFQYHEQEFNVFLCYRLPAGTVLPLDHILVQDNNPAGHCTILRANELEFNAEYCKLDQYPYAHVPELVQAGWEFAGLKMKAAPDPPDFCANFDRELYLFALSVIDYADHLQSIEDFDIICSMLEALKTSDYQWRSDFTVRHEVVRCLSDIQYMMPSPEELNRFIKFKKKFSV
jgi:hypothetical protein